MKIKILNEADLRACVSMDQTALEYVAMYTPADKAPNASA